MSCCSKQFKCAKQNKQLSFAESPVSCILSKNSFEIFFGPDNKYMLRVPLPDSQTKNLLAAQLRAIANELETPNTQFSKQQRLFPF